MDGESVRRVVWAMALGFALLVAVWIGVAALALGFGPLFALLYAFSYGSLAIAALAVLLLALWLAIAATERAIRAAGRLRQGQRSTAPPGTPPARRRAASG